MTFFSLHVGFGHNLVRRLVSTSKEQDIFFKFSVCMFVLAASPDLFFQLTFFFSAKQIRLTKPFQGGTIGYASIMAKG